MSSIQRRPAYAVILEKLEALNQEIEPVIGSFANLGVLQSFLGIAGGVPLKADLFISLLAEIDLEEEELEIVKIKLDEIISNLVDKNIEDLGKLGEPGSTAIDFETQDRESRLRIREDHVNRLIALRDQYGLK